MKLKDFLRNYYELLFKLPYLEKPLPTHPFGRKKWASAEKYTELFQNSIKFDDTELLKFEDNIGYQLNKQWWQDLALHTQVVIKKEPLNFFHGRLLYSVLSKYINKNKSIKYFSIFETGTARGFSSICMAKALNDFNINGNILSLDCISHNLPIYWNCIDDEEAPKTRNDLLSNWEDELSRVIFVQGWTDGLINRIGLNRINFAFLDAQHTKENVLQEFLFVSVRQRKGDIIVFDDVTPNHFDGVCEAVKLISEKYNYDVEYVNFKDDRGYAIAEKII